jgi:thioredoxin reductase
MRYRKGLSTVLIERSAVGGQAGTTSLIENYMGFPGAAWPRAGRSRYSQLRSK